MVQTRAQRRKLHADGAYAFVVEINQQNVVINLTDDEFETVLGVDATYADGNRDVNNVVDPVNPAAGEFVEDQPAKDILNLVVVEVGDFNACVEVPNSEEGIPNLATMLIDMYSDEEEGFGENDWAEDWFGRETDSGEADYMCPFCPGP